MSKQKENVRLIELYKLTTGEELVDTKKVAEWAIEHGHREKPIPKSPVDILNSQLADSVRQETKQDSKTGEEYRVYHAVPSSSQGSNKNVWVDINKAKRPQMLISFQNRRQQIVGDATQLAIDTDYWNNNNPNETHIQMVLDFDLDVKLARHSHESEELA